MKKIIAIFLAVMLLLAVGLIIWFVTTNNPGGVEHPQGGTTNATTMPSGSITESSGSVTEPSSGVTEPSGSVTEPSSGVTEPSGTDSTEPDHTHSYAAAITEPTCTIDGYTTYTCTCGDSYISDEVAATGHSYNTVTVPPTTQGQGYDAHTCIHCGDTYKDNFVDALPEPNPDPEHTHSYTAAVTKPTCTTTGYTVYTCGCGDSYISDETPAAGHDYAAVVTKPTCTAGGYTTYACKTCNHSYTGNHTTALGHDYKTETVPPTPEAKGYDLHTCTRCGHSYKDNYTDAQPDYTLNIGVSKLTVKEGDTYTFNYEYTGTGTLTWSSSNTSVATISSSGKLTAKSVGSAVITLSDGKKSSQCKVTVTEEKHTLTLIVSSKSIYVGDTYQIEYTYTGDKSKLTWKSYDPSVLSVDSNGKVTGLAVSGYVPIEVSDGTTTKICYIEVRAIPDQWVTDIEMDGSDGPLYNGITKYAGDYLWFVVDTKPAGATNEIIVTSSNTNVISVTTKQGHGGVPSRVQITLNFKKAGSATITLTSGDGKVTKSYTITVKSGYDFDPGSGLLSPEEFADYIVKVMCENGFTQNTSLGSWRQFTVRREQMTFTTAAQYGQSNVHEWWPNGNHYCNIVYMGQDEDGDYVFRKYWG